MLRLLFVVLLLIIPYIINAAHLDANIWNVGRLKTTIGKDMYNMKKGNIIYYYYKSGLKEPSCNINIANSKIDTKNVATLSGDNFDSKICIKPSSFFWYFKISETPDCNWTYYESPPNTNIVDTTASCNSYGYLTRFGWVFNEDMCDNEKTKNDYEEWMNQMSDLMTYYDANWMNLINDKSLKLSQINIPGTHDSGTYAIGGDGIFNSIRDETSRTQSLNITEQLYHGIRYLDVRLETNKNRELYLSHSEIDCLNKVTGENYYLSEVLDETVKFLNNHVNETVIVHLKQDNTHEGKYLNNKEIANRIAKLTINNTNRVPFNKDRNKQFKDFYYNANKIPTLDEAKGKIVIFSRGNYLRYYSDLGYTFDIPGMGECDEYSSRGEKTDGEICFPTIMKDMYRIQDNYNLEEDDKWNMVYDVLTNNVPSRTDCKSIYK